MFGTTHRPQRLSFEPCTLTVVPRTPKVKAAQSPHLFPNKFVARALVERTGQSPRNMPKSISTMRLPPAKVWARICRSTHIAGEHAERGLMKFKSRSGRPCWHGSRRHARATAFEQVLENLAEACADFPRFAAGLDIRGPRVDRTVCRTIVPWASPSPCKEPGLEALHC